MNLENTTNPSFLKKAVGNVNKCFHDCYICLKTPCILVSFIRTIVRD